MKKVLIINGSPHENGNTSIALKEIEKQLKVNGIESEIYWIGNSPISDCIACNACNHSTGCVIAQDVNLVASKMQEASGLIVGSPVYYAGPTGALCAFLDRLFRSHSNEFDGKPAACAVVCRRGGASAAFDRLNKFFTISNMPVVPSQYWNSVHGRTPGEANEDIEGLQTMRTLANNMAWMIKNLNEHPNRETKVMTNFIG